MKPKFFRDSQALRKWLSGNHACADVLLVGLYKKGSGKPSITRKELIDQLLCFGWIDGVGGSIDESSYTIRVTPRRPGSVWSDLNLRRAQELIQLGLMEPTGRAALESRNENPTRRYSYDAARVPLDPALEARFRAAKEAWKFFESQPPGYRRLAVHWIMSAKREETRERRLETLIRDSAAGQRLAPLQR